LSEEAVERSEFGRQQSKTQASNRSYKRKDNSDERRGAEVCVNEGGKVGPWRKGAREELVGEGTAIYSLKNPFFFGGGSRNPPITCNGGSPPQGKL